MHIEFDNEKYCGAFVELNEQWIKRYFTMEEADRKMSADPFKVVRDGGHILSLIDDEHVVGVCALLRESPTRFELSKLAVEKTQRGKGYGDALIDAAIAKATEAGATTLYLVSNTVLAPAIALYRKHGFETVLEGEEAAEAGYARANIVMEFHLRQGDG